MSVEIRRAVAEDADIVGTITARSWQAAYKGIIPDDYLSGVTPVFRAERFRTIMSQNVNIEFYLVFVDTVAVGIMNLHSCADADAEGCGEIGVFYFLPEWWGRGVAAPAMEFTINRLKEKGHASVALWVLEENHRARRFYEKQGFVLDGGRKVVHLGKDLTEVRYKFLCPT